MAELKEMKLKNPPKKSPLMKILQDTMKKPATDGEGEEKAEGEEGGEQGDLMLDSIGCTANVVVVDHELKKLFVANAGDSRCVMGAGGKCIPLSFDHKPESEVERKRIEAAGSVITDGRVDGNLNLTRAFGDLKYKQKKQFTPEEQPITSNPDTYEYELVPNADFIIMGCDGIWEKKTNEEMVEWVYSKLGKNKKNANLEAIITELLQKECLSEDHTQSNGLGCDNMTAILIVFN